MSLSNEPPIVLVDPPDPAVVDPAAQPPEAAPPAPGKPSRRATSHDPTWDDVERARQEEKDKLYDRLKKAEESEARLKDLEEKQSTLEKERKKQEKEAEEARLAAEREKMNAQELVESYKKEQEERISQMQESLERERLLREKERQYSELLDYKGRRMAEEGEMIMPQLRDFVRGSTPDEIDQSIETLKQRTASILGEVQDQFTQARAGMQGTHPTGAPPAGPMDLDNAREITLEDLKAMSAEDYANNRTALHQAVRRARGG